MVANLKVERWQVVHQTLRTIVQRRAALDAEEAAYLREAYAIQLWRQLSYIHMGEYLENEMGYGPQVGAERLRVARELGALPQMEARLTAGELSYSAVRELTRIATGETEQAWLDEARGKNLRQIEAMVAGRRRGDRPSDPTKPELVNRIVRLELSPAAFAMLRQAQAVMADDHGGRLDDSAFIEALCRRAVEGSVQSERHAHQIAFTVCESCKRGWQNGAGREIEVAPAVLERARCDAEWIGSLESSHPERVHSTVTPRIRRQVFARDQHRCTVPGCRSARNLDLHHIEYQRDGGGREMSNLTILCSGHHRELHEGTLSIRGTAPDHLTFARHAGGDPTNTNTNTNTNTVAAPRGTVSREASGGHIAPAMRAALRSDASIAPAMRAASRSDATIVPAMRAALRSDASVVPAMHAASRNDASVEPAMHAASGCDMEAGMTAYDARSEAAVARPNRMTRKTDAVDPCANPTLEQVARPSRVTRKTDAIDPCANPTLEQDPRPNRVTRKTEAIDPCANRTLEQDARDALTAAGYSAHIARNALMTARSHVGDAATLEALLRAALRCCPVRGGG